MIQREGTNFDCYTGWNRRVPAPGSAPPDGDLCGRARRQVEVELPHMDQTRGAPDRARRSRPTPALPREVVSVAHLLPLVA